MHVLPFPGVGGTEIATRRVIDAVRRFGVESRALLLRPTAELGDYLRSAGVPFIIPEIVPEPSIRRGFRFLADSRALARISMGVDLVHCADVPGAYYAAVAGRLARVPVLTHVRNRSTSIPRRSRLFVNAATHFAFVSQDTRASFGMPVADARASVVYDGVDIPADDVLATRRVVAGDLRQELNLPPDILIVAMFARVAPQKDYATLVQAAALISKARPQVRFVVIGDYATTPEHRQHFSHVQQLMHEANVADRILFTGFRADTRRLMLAADICLLSTHFEGLPLVILEAMSLGRPCVATAVDGILEALDHERTGLLYPHRDAAALVRCLARLLDDTALADALGRTARTEARRRFGRDRFATDMLDLYARLAQRRDRLRHSSPGKPLAATAPRA